MFSDRLGTARLEEAAWIADTYPYSPGTFWIGRAAHGPAIGYDDDRHVCVACGTRSGKGTSIVTNNLCLWPGSVVSVDPKGEHATVTAARRGHGDEYCTESMGQDVHVLDPFREAKVDDRYRSSYNPLAGLDIDDEKTISEVSGIAASLVIVDDNSENKSWDGKARWLVRGIILHVLSWDRFDDSSRNLTTVAELVQCGDQFLADRMRDAFPDKQIEQPHMLLFRDMQLNRAFGGRVARIGSQFLSMAQNAPKQFEGVLHSANDNLEFVDDPEMVRVLSGEGRTLRLSELKTNARGVSLYLCLPPHKIRDKHYRWLRMMVDLIATQMQITRVKPPWSKAAPTATGYRLLMMLDEFPSLRRMEIIEHAAAEIAGYGVKIVFITQTLKQLHDVYKEGWETFFANAGLKIAFSIDDNFSRDYLSKHIGDTEIVRELQSFNQSQSYNQSFSEGTSQSLTLSQSTTDGTSQSDTAGITYSRTDGVSRSTNQSSTGGVNRSRSLNDTFGISDTMGWSSGASSGVSQGLDALFRGGPRTVSSGANSSLSVSRGISRGASHGITSGTSSGFSRGSSVTFNQSETYGRSDSHTTGSSHSENTGQSETTGTSETRTQGNTSTTGSGRNQTLHRRPLLHPDEVGRAFPRINDPEHPNYPGLALVIISGCNPFVVRRAQYFEDKQFIQCFSPHPDHRFIPALPNTVEGIRPLITTLEQCMNYDALPDGSRIQGRRELVISEWLIEPGSLTNPGQVALRIDGVPPDNRTVHIFVPYSGKVMKTAASKPLSFGGHGIPDGDLFTVNDYPEQTPAVDPFIELRKAYADVLEWLKPKKQEPQPKLEPPPSPQPQPVASLMEPPRSTLTSRDWMVIFGFLAAVGCGIWFLVWLVQLVIAHWDEIVTTITIVFVLLILGAVSGLVEKSKNQYG